MACNAYMQHIIIFFVITACALFFSKIATHIAFLVAANNQPAQVVVDSAANATSTTHSGMKGS